ncbi:hypothetical protein VNO77_04490 [Canavalia gladiata]|uniref:Uncharacterized protein n=1 Tax=Canavalia gladiata TaxID=3824 RepID=A0AAN9N291_CANGL
MPQKSQATINYDSDRTSFADYRGRMKKRNTTVSNLPGVCFFCRITLRPWMILQLVFEFGKLESGCCSKFVFCSAVSSENALKRVLIVFVVGKGRTRAFASESIHPPFSSFPFHCNTFST